MMSETILYYAILGTPYVTTACVERGMCLGFIATHKFLEHCCIVLGVVTSNVSNLEWNN